MNRDQLLLVGLGGAGNRLVDTILNTDDAFQGYFINTSITDLQSLSNFNEIIQNYLCISQQNGVGRNKLIGKTYAQQYSTTIADRLMKYQQKTIFMVSSLGGGSGGSILTTSLEVFREYRKLGIFDKIVNLICIIPDIKSPDIILKNALETWNDILQFSDVVNSIIFIDNGSVSEAFDGAKNDDREGYINEEFSDLFDAIFDIPDSNGINFDNGNLANVLNDKGCLYIYDLKANRGSIELALRKAEQESVLAKMYNDSTNIVEVDGRAVIKCGYIGVSVNDPNYIPSDLIKNYHVVKEPYTGFNEEKNLVLISGCLPPKSTIDALDLEVKERERNRRSEEDNIFSKSFTVSAPVSTIAPANNNFNNVNTGVSQAAAANTASSQVKKMKKVMKKNIFKNR